MSDDNYKALFEALENGFCIVEVDLNAADGEGGHRIDYRVVEANPAFYQQTGFPEAILNQWLRSAAPALEEHWYQLYGEVARSGQPSRFEQGSDLLGRWFDVYAFKSGTGNRVAILFTDITARKAAERKLSELNANLEQQVSDRIQERDQAWQLSSDMLGVADERGEWLSINPAWSRTLGWADTDILGRTSEWMEHPDDIAATRAEVARLSSGLSTFHFENRFRTKSGDFRILSWTAVPHDGRLYCAARDVTGVRMQDAAEAEQTAAKERTWRYSPDLMSVIDMPSATFERVNPAWSLALGWSVQEIEDKPYVDFVHPDDMAASAEAFAKVQAGNPVLRFENRYRTKNGGWRLLSWVAFPEGDKLYSSARDITAEREQEAALLDANELIAVKERAEQQQRMLQNEMAHRIKNTLTMVKAIVSQTLRHASSMEEAELTIEQRIAALSNAQDLLRQTTYTSAPIHEVVEGALGLHLRRHDQVSLEGSYIDLPSRAALGLSLAIHELATNAVKYGALSNDEGRLLISWQHDDDGTFRFEWRERGGPTVTDPVRKGFGTRLINRIVPSYFEGDGTTAYHPHGLVYVLSGKVDHDMPAAPEQSSGPGIAPRDQNNDR